MPRLIDADRALEIVHNQGIAHPNAYHLTNYATLILREAPTVDAMEVVRCKDCKYWRKETLFCGYMPCGETREHVNWYADDFCSYGERTE